MWRVDRDSQGAARPAQQLCFQVAGRTAAKPGLRALSERHHGSHTPVRGSRVSHTKAGPALSQTVSKVAKSKQRGNEHWKGTKMDLRSLHVTVRCS